MTVLAATAFPRLARCLATHCWHRQVTRQLAGYGKTAGSSEVSGGSASWYTREGTDLWSVTKRLNMEAEKVLKLLNLTPNEKLSKKPGEVRIGNKGSLNVLTAQKEVSGTMVGPGNWYSFEWDEKGTMLDLVGRIKGLKDQELLSFAVEQLLPELEGRKAAPPVQAPPPVNREVEKMGEMVVKVLGETKPIWGTLAERYLRSRGLTSLNSPSLRYHPGLGARDEEGQWHSDVPALVAVAGNPKSAVRNVQVTYLDRKTCGKKAGLAVAKRTFGSFQDSLGQHHSCVLSPSHCPVCPVWCGGCPHVTDTTYICEGVETGLSVLQAFPSEHVLVSLGKANMVKMDPDMMTEKVVFVLDNDGLDYSQDALIGRATERLLEASKSVYVVFPPLLEGTRKTDMNDILQREGDAGVHSSLMRNMKRIILS